MPNAWKERVSVPIMHGTPFTLTNQYMPACSASDCKTVICMSYDADNALSGPTHVNATQVYVIIVYICELCVAQRPTPPVDSLRSYVYPPLRNSTRARPPADRLRGVASEGV